MKCIYANLLIVTAFMSGCSDLHRNQYDIDNVYIDIKNDNPCFYINNDELEGNYDIVIKDQNNGDYWDYKGVSEKSYPKKENCILFNNESFGSSKNLNFNRKYNVTLSNLNVGFSNEFCLRKDRNHVVLQKIIGDQCIDIEENEEDKLRRFFKKIF